MDKPAANCEYCDGQHLKIRKLLCSNGIYQFKWQCQRCGKSKGKSINQSIVEARWGTPPDFDTDLRDRWYLVLSRYRRIKQIRAAREYQSNRDKEKEEFDNWYRVYLTSPRWHFKRNLVLKRCGGICEGCQTAKAVVVHHLTYKHVGNELLFELVGLCANCHDIAHSAEANKKEYAA